LIVCEYSPSKNDNSINCLHEKRGYLLGAERSYDNFGESTGKNESVILKMLVGSCPKLS